MTLPSHNDDSLGPAKADRLPVPDRVHYWSASEWNAMVDAIIADATTVEELTDLAYSRKRRFRHVQDFDNGITGTPWASVVSGAGAEVTAGAGPYMGQSNIGAALLNTGTTNVGVAKIHLGASSLIEPMHGRILYDAVVYLDTLSTAGEEFKAYFGCVNDTAAAAPSYGFWFTYNRLALGVNWYATVIGEDGTFNTSTGVAVTAAAWARLSIVLSADGVTVLFYVNGALVRTEVGNTGWADYLGPACLIVKTAGITPRTVAVDLCEIDVLFTTERV